MSKAGTVLKLIIGVVIFLAGIYWYAAGSLGIPQFNLLGLGKYFGAQNWVALKTIVQGVLGLVLILFGALLAWLEWDELKTARATKKGRKK